MNGVGRKRALVKSLKKGDHVVMTKQISARTLADRQTRQATSPRDLTAAIFGDPLPGYSALDRKGAG